MPRVRHDSYVKLRCDVFSFAFIPRDTLSEYTGHNFVYGFLSCINGLVSAIHFVFYFIKRWIYDAHFMNTDLYALRKWTYNWSIQSSCLMFYIWQCINGTYSTFI